MSKALSWFSLYLLIKTRSSSFVHFNHETQNICLVRIWFVSVTCEVGHEVASLDPTGLFSVNENLEAWDPHYAVRAMVDGDLLVLNWSPTETVGSEQESGILYFQQTTAIQK